MQIYSWNMLFRNRHQDEAFEFISKTEFDIFCLQEVPADFLERLRTLPYHLAYRSDVERLFTTGVEKNFVVILSKYPITGQSEIVFPDYWHLLPLRTRLFVRAMRPLGFSKIRNRGGLCVDIETKTARIRIFNLHLILAHPLWRLQEFERAMTNHDKAILTIICGDFNILEKPHIAPLNWILGGRFTDALLFRRERATIEQQFTKHSLQNPIREKRTHDISRSQLDHILVSNAFTVQQAEVIYDRHGSDHHPIYVQIV